MLPTKELSRLLESPKPGVSKIMIFSDAGLFLKLVAIPYTSEVTESSPADVLIIFSPQIEFTNDDFPWPVTPSITSTLKASDKVLISSQLALKSLYR